jgi:hypothetical protein
VVRWQLWQHLPHGPIQIQLALFDKLEDHSGCDGLAYRREAEVIGGLDWDFSFDVGKPETFGEDDFAVCGNGDGDSGYVVVRSVALDLFAGELASIPGGLCAGESGKRKKD